MKLDVMLKSHRSLLGVVALLCLTFLASPFGGKVISEVVYMAFVTSIVGAYYSLSSKENHTKIKNGHKGYINPLTDKAKKLAAEAEKLAREDT